MAVIQVVFKHKNSDIELLTDTKNEQFNSLLRRLVIPEANEWRSEDDIVIDWGDPAQNIDAPILAMACRNGQAYPLFGRSWVHYHRPTQRLTLGVDQLGAYPIIIAEANDTTYIASDSLALAQLLGTHAETDDGALIDLLAFGQLLGTRTTLEGAIHLDAGTVCVVEKNGLRHTYVDNPFVLPQNSGTEEHAIESLLEAVDRRFQVDPDSIIALSGGVDSRLLLAAALATGHRPAVSSFACKGSHQWQIAREVADVTGSEFFETEATPHHFTNAQDSIARLGGGEVALHRGHILASSELIARTRGTTLLTATGAEIFQGVYYDKGIPGNEMFGYSKLKSPLLKASKQYALDAFHATLHPFSKAFPQIAEGLQNRLQQRLNMYQNQASDAAHYLIVFI